ncbi:MAG TPA: N-acetylmuramoyl-L-alanine amidase [bacterium]|nr:N-acetylmuramoyl-L-alanine amidase [bacterium]HPG44473.1 N-acetylmuramoyl-L-alanine amidase [bacterium]HPM97031.1 N-acetylmuramoyl-L-alanine amidase [bacterium]
MSTDYVRLDHFITALGLPHQQDDRFKKFCFTVGSHSVCCSAANPFIRVDGEIRQLPLNILYQNGRYYIPLMMFLSAVQDVWPFSLEYRPMQKEIYLDRGYRQVVEIEGKKLQNGFLFRIQLNKPVDTDDIYTSESNGWFYIDLYGAQVETKKPIPCTIDYQKILEFIPIQLSDETARLSFRISGAIQERKVMKGDNDAQVVVTLRTVDEVAPNLLADLQREREKWKIDVIIIDPGHGGKDPGAIGRNGLYEKKAVLEIGLELKKQLENRMNVKVLMTRDRDRFVPLKQRTKFANSNGGKLFISLHADANPVRSLRGHTVYFLGPAKTEEARIVAQFENSVIQFEDSQDHYKDFGGAAFILGANAQNAYHKESQDLAALIDQKLAEQCSANGHGVRQSGFYVLYGASMPNILIETAFISNRSDEQNLSDRSFQKKMAKAICEGIVEFKERFEGDI